MAELVWTGYMNGSQEALAGRSRKENLYTRTPPPCAEQHGGGVEFFSKSRRQAAYSSKAMLNMACRAGQSASLARVGCTRLDSSTT